MKQKIFHGLEIIFARIAPGLVSLFSLALLAKNLNVSDYGIFSTQLVTAGLLGNCLFGCVHYSILPNYAKYEINGEENSYVSKLLGCVLYIAVPLFIFAGLSILFLDESWSFTILLCICMGICETLQVLLRAKLKFWNYGLVSFSQSLIALLGVVFILSETPKTSEALKIYCFSYLTSFLLAFILLKTPRPYIPDIKFVKNSVSLGAKLVLGTLAESSLNIGLRYMIMFFGTKETLGVFSFSLDLAQRTVGTIINLASFAIVPKAYKKELNGHSAGFKNLLWKSAFVVGLLSILCIVSIVMIYESGLLGDESYFVISAFIMIALGVFVNRLKKMTLDPILIIQNKAIVIVQSYILGGLLTLLLFSLFTIINSHDNFVHLIYLMSLLLVTIFSIKKVS